MLNPTLKAQRVKIRYSLACSLYLSITIALIWLWTNNQTLSSYNLPLTGVIVVCYFFIKTFFGKKSISHPDQLALDVNALVAVILLIISTSGGLNSSVFFLIYFLLFATALIFDNVTTLILTIAIALFFGSSLTSSHAAIQLASLLFFTPLALYFGKLYTNLLTTRHHLKELHNDYQNVSKDITKEESLILPWLTLNFKNAMIKVIGLTSDMMSEIGIVKPRHQDKLKEILKESKELMESGNKLKEEIDKETDW